MHTLYEQKYPDYSVKYKFYSKYFQENFSLSFGRKQIDVCGLCEELKIKLKNPHINENEKEPIKQILRSIKDKQISLTKKHRK